MHIVVTKVIWEAPLQEFDNLVENVDFVLIKKYIRTIRKCKYLPGNFPFFHYMVVLLLKCQNSTNVHDFQR